MGEYVRMSDIDVFSQSIDGDYSFSDLLGLEVFANGNAETTSLFIIFLFGVPNQIQEILYLECG